MIHGDGPEPAIRIMRSDQSGRRRGFQPSTSARTIRLMSASEGVLDPPWVVLSSTYGTFTTRTRGLSLLVASHGFSHDRDRLGDPRGDGPGRHPQHHGDLLSRQPFVIVKDDRRAQLGAEGGERLADDI